MHIKALWIWRENSPCSLPPKFKRRFEGTAKWLIVYAMLTRNIVVSSNASVWFIFCILQRWWRQFFSTNVAFYFSFHTTWQIMTEHVIILRVQRQVTCRGMCIIVVWFDNYKRNYSKENVHKILTMGSYTRCHVGLWITFHVSPQQTSLVIAYISAVCCPLEISFSTLEWLEIRSPLAFYPRVYVDQVPRSHSFSTHCALSLRRWQFPLSGGIYNFAFVFELILVFAFVLYIILVFVCVLVILFNCIVLYRVVYYCVVW